MPPRAKGVTAAIRAVANAGLKPAAREHVAGLGGFERGRGRKSLERIARRQHVHHVAARARRKRGLDHARRERHGGEKAHVALAPRRADAGRPEREEVSARLELSVGRVEDGGERPFRILGLRPLEREPAGGVGERHQRVAELVRGGDEAVRLRSAHFLLVGGGFVGKVLDARQERLRFVSVRGAVDEKGHVGNVIHMRGAVDRDGGTYVQSRTCGGERARPGPGASGGVLHRGARLDTRTDRLYLCCAFLPGERLGLAVRPLDHKRLVRVTFRPRLAVGDEGERAHASAVVAQLPAVALQDERICGERQWRRGGELGRPFGRYVRGAQVAVLDGGERLGLSGRVDAQRHRLRADEPDGQLDGELRAGRGADGLKARSLQLVEIPLLRVPEDLERAWGGDGRGLQLDAEVRGAGRRRGHRVGGVRDAPGVDARHVERIAGRGLPRVRHVVVRPPGMSGAREVDEFARHRGSRRERGDAQKQFFHPVTPDSSFTCRKL